MLLGDIIMEISDEEVDGESLEEVQRVLDDVPKKNEYLRNKIAAYSALSTLPQLLQEWYTVHIILIDIYNPP